jgi:hypothetical protein
MTLIGVVAGLYSAAQWPSWGLWAYGAAETVVLLVVLLGYKRNHNVIFTAWLMSWVALGYLLVAEGVFVVRAFQHHGIDWLSITAAAVGFLGGLGGPAVLGSYTETYLEHRAGR